VNALPEQIREKKAVALSSVIASMFLTGGKLAVGLMTGSLGILSEAAHSALDFGAAVITYFAVQVSDKPADRDHHYGYHKVENLSALVETFLLLITCVWIIKEATARLIFKETALEVNFWSFAVIIISIVVDFSRSRALSRAAKKYHSQALEADAMHFSSDILSSLVVLLGLILVRFDIKLADPLAALIVAVLVIVASIRLGKRAVDALLDRAPTELNEIVINEILCINGVCECHKLRLRQSGPRVYGDIHVVIHREINFLEGHEISRAIEEKLSAQGIDIVVHFEPEEEKQGGEEIRYN